eukprot:2687330-Amphidinium_carterae.2
MGLLIEELARHPRVDSRKIVLYGFSAGAYAITELLTTHQSVPARAIVLGGVHGHGDSEAQCRVLNLPMKLQARIAEFDRKWDAYLYRLISGPNVHAERFVVVRNTLDTLSYWEPASAIWNALDQSRIWAGASMLRRVLFTRQASIAFKQGHNYWRLTFEEVIDELIALRVDPPLSEQTRIEIVNDRLASLIAAEPDRNPIVRDTVGDYVVMMSFAPSSSSMLETPALAAQPPPVAEEEDPIPAWALPCNMDEDEIPPHVFDPYSGSSGSGSTSSSLVEPTLPSSSMGGTLPTVAENELPIEASINIEESAIPTVTHPMTSTSRSSSTESFHSLSEDLVLPDQIAQLEATFLLMGSTPRSIPEGQLDLDPPPSVGSGPHYANLEHELPDDDMHSAEDSADEEDDLSSSSDEEMVPSLAATRYLRLHQGVHDWHVDFPNDPRDLRAPFLRTLLHD